MPTSPEVLEAQVQELRKSMAMLERSNALLAQEESDPEYTLAMSENVATLARFQAQVRALEEELGPHIN